MELSKELIEKFNLPAEAVQGINEFGAGLITQERQTISEEFKGVANKNAEGILSGAMNETIELTGFSRNEGEHVAAFISRASKEFLKNKEDALQKEYDQKLKNAEGGDLDRIKLDFETEKNDLLKKYADFDTIKGKADKADEYQANLSSLKLKVAFSDVKPSFPEGVNTYEINAKWAEFKNKVLEENHIELDENNEPVYISKENAYVTGKLKDLVDKDITIQELKKGRQQEGLGGQNNASAESIEGVPFKVDTSKNVSIQIKDYLTNNKKLDVLSRQYSKEFGELLSKIRQKTAA